MRKYSISNPNPRSDSKIKEILFYDKNDPYYEFTNFSDHPVFYNGQRYATSEHLFQALKFLDHQPGIAAEIRNLTTPREVYNKAQLYKQYVRPDWFNVNIAMVRSVSLVGDLKTNGNGLPW
ncbi:hypothetical protein H0H87_012043 [Tephrocybe sp. NHM501043]|nr:hypothetical protein H0H87_012043 [Tephrocybe sp. NHM501043]